MHINNHFQQGANPRDVLPRPLTAIVVQQRNDHGEWVADDVATTFGALTEVAGLANNWLADNNRVHRRMLFEFPWRPISEATDQLSAVIAISHAWASYSAIHGELGFVCASIRTDSILYYEANGITHGMFLGVGEAIDMRTITQRQPPLEEGPMAMRAIRPSENPEAPPTFVDDAESLFYLVCSLGTFGINQAQRAVFVEDPSILIMLWNKGAAVTSARLKRAYLSNEMVLTENILFFMRPGPLHDLALDMYRVLFLHPGTFGTTRINNAQLAAMRDDGIAAALRALPVIDGRRDPLALRLQFVVEIIRNLLNILDQHRGVLAGLGAGAGAGAGA
ncbi:hypothetical protein H4218_004702 [Coemansia sp. IMI 209128]|nr:hypothetical protein GGI10_000532 [Coemansia sp. RSA 2530]KAJ2696263.1 hypothetical protein H4218_004702 [Coemansia sp. IMI 209128]